MQPNVIDGSMKLAMSAGLVVKKWVKDKSISFTFDPSSDCRLQVLKKKKSVHAEEVNQDDPAYFLFCLTLCGAVVV